MKVLFDLFSVIKLLKLNVRFLFSVDSNLSGGFLFLFFCLGCLNLTAVSLAIHASKSSAHLPNKSCDWICSFYIFQNTFCTKCFYHKNILKSPLKTFLFQICFSKMTLFSVFFKLLASLLL